ncbi:MAG: hypothetical protein KDC24_04395 [Saprospiraceae bacterium]|nr:hypothetical protein [Saprospiraceae bacterium]
MKINTFLFFLVAFVCMLSATALSAQDGPANNKDEFQQKYEWRIKREILNGVYIPKDLGDAFNELNKKIDAESKAKFLMVPEDTAAIKLHFSLGRWMIVNWGFYEGSRFSHYLRQAGITYPDDMARFVIITYHRFLNEKPLEIKALAESIKEERQADYKQKMEGATILHEETRVREKEPEKEKN